ncbi:alcohol dehydrogenase catalytic domain-containing protein [Thermomonospora umbrina]|uniref:S-(Hydroxymethyl)glutathione dehydrogenase/alcohol dehydrogenase n=1 Tax=Thermomonospora umbrina TaxID=111806 RepID=A0A3D9T0U4_9ACTN|nr:alcohol dehydrogenase catalytic domain-containing protein [Thermomonospora umbrina]REE98865.1 S-(hydroxymethyl)glutathione dehydrogenase/alcohol dehydrogenase [Thermomonospora umbrina]
MARAAVLDKVGDTELDLRDDVTPVDPGPDDVRVRIRATGVCHSDLSAMNGVLPTTVPAVLGHEGAGEVLEVGERVTEVRPGDHVVINWTPSCGVCADCVRGEPFLCATFLMASFTEVRFRRGDDTALYGMAGCGTWAEEITMPRQGVIKVADDVPFEYAALLGCGIPTGLGAVFNTARVRPGATVAVVGAGGVGLSVIQGARIAGASTILAVDPNEARHPLAERFGATHTVVPDEADAVRGPLTSGVGFDHAFEVVGRSAAIATAYRLARRGGEVVVVGVAPATEGHRLDPFGLVFDGKSVRASLYGGCDLRRDVPRFVDLWRAGRLDIEGLVSHRIGFADLNDAVRRLERREAVRQVVVFD